MEMQRSSQESDRLLSWQWLSRKQNQELLRCRKRLARRLRRHVRSIAKAHVDRQIARQPGLDAKVDRSAVRALIGAECAAAAQALSDEWLREIERCFVRMRGQDPQFFLYPPNLDASMLPVRSLSAEWRINRLVTEYGAAAEQVREALKAARDALPKDEAPFPPEAIRYFEILGCFVSSRL